MLEILIYLLCLLALKIFFKKHPSVWERSCLCTFRINSLPFSSNLSSLETPNSFPCSKYLGVQMPTASGAPVVSEVNSLTTTYLTQLKVSGFIGRDSLILYFVAVLGRKEKRKKKEKSPQRSSSYQVYIL